MKLALFLSHYVANVKGRLNAVFASCNEQLKKIQNTSLRDRLEISNLLLRACFLMQQENLCPIMLNTVSKIWREFLKYQDFVL